MKVLNSIKKNSILVFIITIIVLYISLKNDFSGIVNAFKNINIGIMAIAVIFLFLSIIIKGYANYLIIDDKKLSPWESIKHNIIVQFFNGVTPFQTGGQPMEILMLKEHGISLSKATNRTTQNFLYYQIALVLCGVIAVIYNHIYTIFPKNSLLEKLVVIGFIVNALVALFLVLISCCKTITMKACHITKKIAKKLKWKITDKELETKFEDYYNGFQETKHKKKIILFSIFLNIVSLICLYITPFYILYSMTNKYSLSIINTLITSSYVYIMAAFIPIPGATGGIEYGFTQFFGTFIGIDMITPVLLLWRFIVYHIAVITGAIVFNLEKKVTN